MDAGAPSRDPVEARPHHPVRRTLVALLALAVAAGAVLGVRQQVGLIGKQSDLRVAFPELGGIDGEQWRCLSDESQGRFTYSCSPPSDPVETVNYTRLPAVQSVEALVAEVEAENARQRAEDSTGESPTIALLGTDDWVPAGQTQPWGTVTRWQFDGFVGGPLVRATYRYADAPFGLTVYADSTTRIDEIVRSLTLRPPDQLPD